ncbi:GntR family transcriptional regulator [Streptacidiphilus sp. EB129]|uniref:GntR family transcriptional regulator n=1 Tax=Streptacidiphilus sp. EB129 TaxID=3156262 RepID=UPI003513BE74
MRPEDGEAEAAAGAGLDADRERLARTSTAERVADILRDRITDGYFRPGTQLIEEKVTDALGISRNTLREAFQLLAHERLLVRRPNRGVFVREITATDVVDIYRARRLLQCAAVRTVTRSPVGLDAAECAVSDAEAAARRGAWDQVGTADVRFHQAITALGGSRRVDELMRSIGAELRLVFHTMTDTRGFHEPYLSANRRILDLLRAGDGPEAERLLTAYLNDAEAALLAHLQGPA